MVRLLPYYLWHSHSEQRRQRICHPNHHATRQLTMDPGHPASQRVQPDQRWEHRQHGRHIRPTRPHRWLFGYNAEVESYNFLARPLGEVSVPISVVVRF